MIIKTPMKNLHFFLMGAMLCLAFCGIMILITLLRIILRAVRNFGAEKYRYIFLLMKFYSRLVYLREGKNEII